MYSSLNRHKEPFQMTKQHHNEKVIFCFCFLFVSHYFFLKLLVLRITGNSYPEHLFFGFYPLSLSLSSCSNYQLSCRLGMNRIISRNLILPWNYKYQSLENGKTQFQSLSWLGEICLKKYSVFFPCTCICFFGKYI